MVGAEAVVSGIRGRTEVRGVSGDTTLLGLSGPVRAESVSGSLEAQSVTGALRVNSMTGDVTVIEGAGVSVQAETVSGDMVVDLAPAGPGGPPADIRLTSVSGEVAIRLPHPADARVEASTTSGSVSNAFEDLRVGGQWGARTVTGTLGPGRGTLRATTVSGSIALLRRPEADEDTGAGPSSTPLRDRKGALTCRPSSPTAASASICSNCSTRPPPRLRGDQTPGGALPGPLRTLGRHGLPPPGQAGGRGARHPRQRGGRKVYSITDAGRAELAGRGAELDDLEREIRESVSELAAEIRDDVRGAAGRVRSEMRAAAGRARTAEASSFTDAKEELRRVGQEWKQQAREARAEARSARRQAKEFQRIAQQVQEEVQDHFARGDWPKGVWEGISGITAQLGDLVTGTTHPKAGAAGQEPPFAAAPAGEAPEWARDVEGSGDPARDLDRLLDRFRDEIRDAARDHGVTRDQVAETRDHLAAAAHRITDLLRPDRKG